MSNHISAAKAASRDNARTDDGKFGHQVKNEAPDVNLTKAQVRPKPIMATVFLEQWDSNDNAIEVGRAEFDASRLLA